MPAPLGPSLVTVTQIPEWFWFVGLYVILSIIFVIARGLSGWVRGKKEEMGIRPVWARRRNPERANPQAMPGQARRPEGEQKVVPSDAGQPGFWRNLGWWDFEIAVLLAFERVGYAGQATAPSKDAGLDGIIEHKDNKDDKRGIQCKHFGPNDSVGVADIRDLIGALHMGGLKKGYFVTTGRYSDDAQALAKQSQMTTVTIELLNVNKLVEMGANLQLTPEAIADAKRRWNVPQEPPPDMPQGPQRRRIYRGGWGGRSRHRRRY
jgi:hypothetical protein